jgi:tetratricopeptide (TPR) repeat protein
MAMCIDRTAAHADCVAYCDEWLAKLPDNTDLRRVRAETIVDGFCIGKEKDGVRIVEPSSLEFFSTIVRQPERRQLSDFCYLARLQEWMGDVHNAMELLSEAKTLWPDSWNIPFNAASFQLRANDLQAARTNALTATEAAPWRPQAWRLLAHVYQALGLQHEASQAFAKAQSVERQRKALLSDTPFQ